jgi:hypothetical protein
MRISLALALLALASGCALQLREPAPFNSAVAP